MWFINDKNDVYLYLFFSALNFSVKLLKFSAIYYFNRSEYFMNASPMNVAAPPNDAPTAVYMLYNYNSVG